MEFDSDVETLVRYYAQQAGGDFQLYDGAQFQRGYGWYLIYSYNFLSKLINSNIILGIGSWLGGLFRLVVPLIKKSSAYVGRELLKSAGNVLDDVDNNVDFRTAVRARGGEAFNNIAKRAIAKMQGGAYKKVTVKRKRTQSTSKRARGKTSKKVVKKKKPVKSKKQKKAKPQKRKQNLAAIRRDYFDYNDGIY